MAKPEIQSTIYASHQLVTQRDTVHAFYTFINIEYQQNSDVINDVIDYLLCFVLSNELFIKIILLLLVLRARHHMKTKCVSNGLWIQSCCCINKVNVLNNLKLM